MVDRYNYFTTVGNTITTVNIKRSNTASGSYHNYITTVDTNFYHTFGYYNCGYCNYTTTVDNATILQLWILRLTEKYYNYLIIQQ